MKRLLIAVSVLALAGTAAFATTWFDAGGAGLTNVVVHFLNGSNVATPVTSSAGLPVNVVGGGGGGGPATLASGAVASGAYAAGSIGAGAAVDGWNLTEGVTTGAAVTTDAAGTLQQYLRGLVKLDGGLALESGGNLAAVAAVAGTKTDAASTATDATSVSAMSVAKQISKSVQAAVTALGSPMQASGGSVTANAGTNLNTSLLALETGGNLAAVAGVAGATTGAAVTTDANGTMQQYLRGLVKLDAGGIPLLDAAGVNKATVKAASTLPVATDTTVVVGLNPGTATAGTPTGAIITVQGVSGGQAVPVSGTVTATVTGVATATNQTNVTAAAGSQATDALAVQGITSMVPLLVNPGTAASWGIVAQGSTTSGEVGPLAQAAVTGTAGALSAPSYTTAQTAPLSVDLHGGLRLSSAYPAGAVPETVTATGSSAATTATLAASASATTYICGFSIRANATAAATAEATVTGVITATMDFLQWTAPLASGIGVTEEVFQPCIPASAVNTTISVVSAAPGSGGTVSVSAWGFQL